MLRGRLLLLGAVSLAIAAIRLGESRALDPHEIYVAGTATEMLETGELLIPSFNGKPRIEKPPRCEKVDPGHHQQKKLIEGRDDEVRLITPKPAGFGGLVRVGGRVIV